MKQKNWALITPSMVRDHEFPSRELRVPHCFKRWAPERPSLRAHAKGHLQLVGVTAGSRDRYSDALLPAIHFAVLSELCRYKLRAVPGSRAAVLEDDQRGLRGYFPRTYHWELVTTSGGRVLSDVRKLWRAGREQQPDRSCVVATAAAGWKEGHEVTLPAYQANIWMLFDLADEAASDIQAGYRETLPTARTRQLASL
jgi:Tfp pilus assembly protein PilV